MCTLHIIGGELPASGSLFEVETKSPRTYAQARIAGSFAALSI